MNWKGVNIKKIKIKYIPLHYKLNYCDKKEYFQVPIFKVIIDGKDLSNLVK